MRRKDASFSAICATLKGLEQRSIESLRRMLLEMEWAGPSDELLKALDTALEQQDISAQSGSLGKRKRSEDPWRQRVLQILVPDVFDRSEDYALTLRNDSNDAAWISSIIECLRRKLTVYVCH